MRKGHFLCVCLHRFYLEMHFKGNIFIPMNTKALFNIVDTELGRYLIVNIISFLNYLLLFNVKKPRIISSKL